MLQATSYKLQATSYKLQSGAPFFAQRRVGDGRPHSPSSRTLSVPHPFLRKEWGTGRYPCPQSQPADSKLSMIYIALESNT